MNQERHGNCWVICVVLFLIFFALCFLLFLTLLAGCHFDSTPGNYCCLFPLLWVFLWMYRLFSVVFLVERGTGRNKHGVVVEWISEWCVCLVSACSSWYVLYLFVRFSFGLLSTCVTTGWIFEISLCENSIKSINSSSHIIFYLSRVGADLCVSKMS